MVKKMAAAAAAGLIGGALILAGTAKAQDEAPFVRITYICTADFDGVALAYNGVDHDEVEVNEGDHIWRIRHESGPAASWETNFLGMSGDIEVDEVQFVTTAEGAAGVSVSTEPGPNGYQGTASSNDSACEEAPPFVRITYICEADGDGITRAFAGGDTFVDVEVNDGDHIWRIRHESGPAASWETNFLGMSGTIGVAEVQFVATAEGANGVKVSTEPGPNKYQGTASVSGETCEESTPVLPDDPTEDEKNDKTDDSKTEDTTPVADDKLPVTGTGLPILIGAGLVLLVGGGATMALARRRGLV